MLDGFAVSLDSVGEFNFNIDINLDLFDDSHWSQAGRASDRSHWASNTYYLWEHGRIRTKPAIDPFHRRLNITPDRQGQGK